VAMMGAWMVDANSVVIDGREQAFIGGTNA